MTNIRIDDQTGSFGNYEKLSKLTNTIADSYFVSPGAVLKTVNMFRLY